MVLSYVTYKNILMFTFTIITLSQDFYWNSKQNIPPTIKLIIRRKLFKTDLNWFMSCDVIFMLIGR